MKIAGWIATFLFVLSAAVQWNDPDPLAWIAAYLAAAAVSAAGALGKPVRPVAAALGIAYIAAAVFVAPESLGASFDELVAPAMKTVAIERARESLGLAICAGWMFVLLLRGPRR